MCIRDSATTVWRDWETAREARRHLTCSLPYAPYRSCLLYTSLSKEDNTIYQMIAGRMVEAFSEKCVKDVTTVTALAASYLHNVKGYNVAVVDCDDPQHSIHGLREHDIDVYKRQVLTDHINKIAFEALSEISVDTLYAQRTAHTSYYWFVAIKH